MIKFICVRQQRKQKYILNYKDSNTDSTWVWQMTKNCLLLLLFIKNDFVHVCWNPLSISSLVCGDIS